MAMYYCGLDLHAKSSAFCMVTARGKRLAEGEIPSTRRGFDALLERSEGELVRVVLEASTRTRWAAQQLERLGAEVVVVDPRKVRVIAETKHKTDKTDARILADLLRTGALPKPVWQATEATRELRDQVRLRWGLVRERANLTLRARSMLSSVGINLGKRALASEATWERVLKRRDVPAHMKTLLEVLHDSMQHLGEAIAAVEKEYAPRLSDPVIERLQEIPGVGPVVAVTTVAALGDPGRFRNSRTAAAYTGLVPTERSSGERRRRGHITKQGSSELRRVWIQAAQAALRMRNHPLKAWAQRLIYRRGRAIAVVALARRMFRWAFAMWKYGKRFDVKLATGSDQ
jgi:transposase